MTDLDGTTPTTLHLYCTLFNMVHPTTPTHCMLLQCTVLIDEGLYSHVVLSHCSPQQCGCGLRGRSRAPGVVVEEEEKEVEKKK